MFEHLFSGKKAFPGNLAAWLCSRSHIEKMTRELQVNEENGLPLVLVILVFATLKIEVKFPWET